MTVSLAQEGQRRGSLECKAIQAIQREKGERDAGREGLETLEWLTAGRAVAACPLLVNNASFLELASSIHKASLFSSVNQNEVRLKSCFHHKTSTGCIVL